MVFAWEIKGGQLYCLHKDNTLCAYHWINIGLADITNIYFYRLNVSKLFYWKN